MTDCVEGAEDVTTVMAQVLHRMERIVAHLREKGENDAANSIAKNTLSAVSIFNKTIAPWDNATSIMRPDSADPLALPSKSNHTPSKPLHLDAIPTPPSAPTSWAAVAAVAPAANNKVVKYSPGDTMQMKMKEEHPTPALVEPGSEKRVVWIRGWSSDKPLSEITNKLGQGPIYSMAYSDKDAAVCVIFQYSSSANALFIDDKQFSKTNGHSRFGPGCDVVEGLPFPDSDDMRRMSPPLNERRRLTFARSQFFTHGMTRERFKNDIYSMVGEKNVELVWLFNTATVVFSAVPLARLVRNEFIQVSKSPGSPYHGVAITFSHDPCERPMTLITQIQTGHQLRPATTYGRNGVLPAEISTKGAPLGRRGTVNELDGWQTVGRRRQ